MDNTNALSVSEKDFAKRLYEETGFQGSSVPRPPTVRLNGDSGLFEIKIYNTETRQSEKQSFPAPFEGTILMVRNQIRWKYAEDSKVWVQSEEFNSNKDIFTLWKREQGNKEQVALFTGDYPACRAKYEKLDEVTGKRSIPYDYLVILYVDCQDKIVRVELKGQGRSNWFDFSQAFHRDNNGIHLAQRSVVFSSAEYTGAKGKYFGPTMEISGPSPLSGEEALRKIKELKSFFAMFEAGRHDDSIDVESEPVVYEQPAIAPKVEVIAPKQVQNTNSTNVAQTLPPGMDYLSKTAACKTIQEVDGLIELVRLDVGVSDTKRSVILGNLKAKRDKLEMDSIPF